MTFDELCFEAQRIALRDGTSVSYQDPAGHKSVMAFPDGSYAVCATVVQTFRLSYQYSAHGGMHSMAADYVRKLWEGMQDERAKS